MPAHCASGVSVAVLLRRIAAGRSGKADTKICQLHIPFLYHYLPAGDGGAGGCGVGLDLRRVGLVLILMKGRAGSELDGRYGDGTGIAGAAFISAGLERLIGGV